MQAFLFSDIESSTRLWEEHPVEMSQALERHDAIMREAITQAGGRLLKTTGDGAIAVFPSAAAAIHACIAAQQALIKEVWDSTPVRVRMGVHAGDTLTRDDDHFGPVMNRTARIMAAGHGGQVLVSQTAANLAAAGLSDDTVFRDLGTHRLKDLTEPEHLYQLVHSGLVVEFPDLKTLDSRPNNLPVQATEFLGRTQELAAIHLMLENPATRLLTIAGPGGAGKTRLSLQVAADLVDTFRDGVWFVDLAADSAPDDAFESVIRALSLSVSRTGAPLDVLKNRLRDRNMLLVLDNFEQVVAAGPSVAELLQSAPELKVLVTSRETLRVRGEQVYPVPPLSLPHPDHSIDQIAESEAVQLFVERATAASPAFVLSDENASAIAAICLRLDGLPLAIELAASRLNLFTPADLLNRITDRLDVLASGGRDLPDRQRTLWGAIGWSYELLTPEERALFDVFAVFEGAELAALEAVASTVVGTNSILDTLSSLVDKSLVRRSETSGSIRFSMLQMIKEYAADRLAERSDRQTALTAAHADYYASFAAEQGSHLDGPDRTATLLRLEADIDNLRSAWRHWVSAVDHDHLAQMMIGLWELQTARGWYHGAIELAGDMLGVLADTEPSDERDADELKLRIRQARALMAVYGYNLEVERAFARALELTESGDASEDRIPVLRALASYHLQTANFRPSLEIGQQLLEIGLATGDEAVELEGRGVIANSVLYVDAALCLEHLDHVIRRYDPAKHGAGYQLGPNTGVTARVAAGFMHWEVGDLELAVNRIREAVEFAAAIDHPYSLTWAVYHQGFLAVSRSRFDDVLEASRRLAALSEKHDYVLWRTLATVLEGVAVAALDDPQAGMALTEHGVDLYQGLAPPPVFWPFLLGLRAGVHAMAGQLPKALDLTNEALAIMEGSGTVPPDLLVRKGDLVHAVRGPEDPEVRELYEQGAELAMAMGLRLPALRAHTRLVRLRRAMGDTDDGSAALADLLATFSNSPDEADVLDARETLDA